LEAEVKKGKVIGQERRDAKREDNNCTGEDKRALRDQRYICDIKLDIQKHGGGMKTGAARQQHAEG
jgi:hypothetical protein